MAWDEQRGLDDEQFALGEEQFALGDEQFGLGDAQLGLGDEKFGLDNEEFGVGNEQCDGSVGYISGSYLNDDKDDVQDESKAWVWVLVAWEERFSGENDICSAVELARMVVG